MTTTMAVRAFVAMVAMILLIGCGGGDTETISNSGANQSGNPPLPPTATSYTLNVAVSGSGTVTSSPEGINCGGDCSESYASGTSVTLTATAVSGYSFNGWSGACSGGGACVVSMIQARSAAATFTSASPPPPPSPPPSSGGPALFFSDLVSGPRSGNSDTSHGPGGAIVTIWGKNLGDSQTSTLTIGGATVPSSAIYYWGRANDRGTAPRGGGADLYARMGMQMIEFQIPENAGGNATLPVAVTISVTVNNVMSNPLTFTLRAGNIYFVSPSGNDTNDGAFSRPWRSYVPKARDTIAQGDIVYFMDGFVASATAPVTGGSIIPLNTSGTSAMPKALVAYPGATVKIGDTACETTSHAMIRNYDYNADRPSSHWVLSKLRVSSPSTCAQSTAVEIGTGFRLIGNYLSTPRTSDGCQSGTVQCGGIGPCGNDVFMLGNEMTAVQTTNWSTGSKQCHGFYISGSRVTDQLESNREIAWNYIHDNSNNRAINIYNEAYNPTHAYLAGHRVHDNWIENQAGIGVLIGAMVVGDNWFYNNVIVNAGLGPDLAHPNVPSKFIDDGGYTPLQLNFGGTYVSSDPASNWARDHTVLHAYNNLIYGGSNPGLLTINLATQSMTYTVGLMTYSPLRPDSTYPMPTLNFNNNILVATLDGVPYMPSYSTLPAGRNNLWYGAGNCWLLDINDGHLIVYGKGTIATGECATMPRELDPNTGIPLPSPEVNPVTADPQFVDASNRNFRLRTTSPVSPAKDAGTSNVIFDLLRPSEDFDGIARPQNGVVDIGPFEAQ